MKKKENSILFYLTNAEAKRDVISINDFKLLKDSRKWWNNFKCIAANEAKNKNNGSTPTPTAHPTGQNDFLMQAPYRS